ncbi:hypothetical protein BDL97_03G023600 [Sphagnum fallax]|nr:hypothetical protein BDL97_03G023600 [Sphagnum fallax]
MGRQSEQIKSPELLLSSSSKKLQLLNNNVGADVEDEQQKKTRGGFMFPSPDSQTAAARRGGKPGGYCNSNMKLDVTSPSGSAQTKSSSCTTTSTADFSSPRGMSSSTTSSRGGGGRYSYSHAGDNMSMSTSSTKSYCGGGGGGGGVSKQLDFSSPGSAASSSNNAAAAAAAAAASPHRRSSYLRTPPRAAHDNNNIKGRTTTTSYETTEYKLDVEEEAAAQPQAPIKQQLGNIAHVLQASGGRLEQLYKKISESAVKDHGSVLEGLQWDILKESGYISWCGLACTLGSYLSCHCEEINENSSSLSSSSSSSKSSSSGSASSASSSWSENNKYMSSMKVHVDLVLDQVEELKLCLESDSHIYKLVASTLLYCCSVVRHLEKRSDGCSCFGSRINNALKQQIDNSIRELKSLQENLNFATLAALGNRTLDSSIPVTGADPVYAKTPRQEQLTVTVGLEQHMTHITDFLNKSSTSRGVSFIGIYGQAGVGKTTFLNKIVAHIEKAEKRMFAYVEVSEDLRHLQSSLLLQLGGEKKEFSSTAQGRKAILYQLQKMKQQCKAVRIAVDNLFDIRMVGELFPHSMGKVLPTNSCVIVTCPSLATVNKMDQLCRTATPTYRYLPFKLPRLAYAHAKALFLSHAASRPLTSLSSANGMNLSRYENLATQFLPLCDGLPLALKIVGLYFSNPFNRNEENWMAVAKRMKLLTEAAETPEDQMFSKLMVIYEKLGPAEKEAFQDLAAFFHGWDWRTVQRIVGKPQLDALVDQGLVHAKLTDVESIPRIAKLTCYSELPWKTEMVTMHDLLYALACKHTQGNRVLSEDQTHLPDRILMDGPGMEPSQIQGLSLISCKEALQGSMLERMLGLRILILHDTLIKGYCTKVLSQLQFFYWGKSLVARDVRVPFQMGRLRKLETLILRANEIDLAMKLPPHLKDLTVIGCNNIDEIPVTVLLLTTLMELHLISCNKLQDLTHAFGNLKMLRRFRLENCMNIRQLPRSIGQLTNLQELDLSGCANLTTLPSEVGFLVALNKLNLTRCKSLLWLPPEIGSLHKLTYLNLGQCGVATLAPEIGQLRMLEDLSLLGCVRLEKLPKEIGQLGCLLQLNLGSCTGLTELPREIGRLSSLKKLSLNSCTSMARLPIEIFELYTLQALDLDYCKLLAHLPSEIGNLRSLEHLSLNCCTRLNRLPLELANLPCLKVINLVGCTGLKFQSMTREIQTMAKENSIYTHRDNNLVILEGPENPSFKLYNMAY